MNYLSKVAKLVRLLFFRQWTAPNQSRVSAFCNGLQNVNFEGENIIPEFCVFAGVTKLGYRTTLGKNNYLVGDVTIGRYCQIGASVAFHSSDHPVQHLSTYINSKLFEGRLSQLKKLDPILVGNDVWVGHGAVILSGVNIGDGAIIGAGSVVTKDVPPYSIVVGNPARILKYRFENKIIQELLELKWWDLPPEKLNQLEPLFFTDLSQVDSIYDILTIK